MLLTMIVVFFILLVVNMPIAFVIGASAMVALVFSDIPTNLIITRMFASVDSFPLLAIPLFVFAGEIMATCGLTERLVRFASALLGHIRGSLAQVNVVGSMFFAGMQGSATTDVCSLGSIEIAAMLKQGYSKPFTVAITTASAIIGPLIPPSMLMIVYGSLANVSITQLFIAGFIPGVLYGLGQMVLAWYFAKKEGMGKVRERFDWIELRSSLKETAPAVLLPVLIMGGILSGIVTPTEAGVIAVLYTLVISKFYYKSFKMSDLLKIAMQAAKTSTVCLFFVALSSIFAYLLAYTGAAEQLLALLLSISSNPNVILLIIITFIFVLGFFIEGVPILIIFTTLLVPVASQLGFDLVHFGVVLVMVCLVGAITPPVGIILYIASSLAQIQPSKAYRIMIPFVAVYVIIMLAIAFYPPLVTTLPKLLMGR